MENKLDTTYGEVKIRNAMIDTNGTDLVDGIEISGDFETITLLGYRNVESFNKNEIESLIEIYRT